MTDPVFGRDVVIIAPKDKCLKGAAKRDNNAILFRMILELARPVPELETEGCNVDLYRSSTLRIDMSRIW